MFVYAHTSSRQITRSSLAMRSSINPSLISPLLTKLALQSLHYQSSKQWHIYALRVAYGNNLLRINNTNTMVTMSREPIEKSCSSKQFQYSQETIETLQNIMREVASKMERPNVSIKRRKLTGWNIFTKRKSLESMLQREFVDDNEFIGYVIDNKEFKYQSKRHRNRRRIRMNVGVADKLSTGSIRKEFNNLTLDKRYFYDELANALTKLRDEDEEDKKVVCGI